MVANPGGWGGVRGVREAIRWQQSWCGIPGGCPSAACRVADARPVPPPASFSAQAARGAHRQRGVCSWTLETGGHRWRRVASPAPQRAARRPKRPAGQVGLARSPFRSWRRNSVTAGLGHPRIFQRPGAAVRAAGGLACAADDVSPRVCKTHCARGSGSAAPSVRAVAWSRGGGVAEWRECELVGAERAVAGGDCGWAAGEARTRVLPIPADAAPRSAR